MHLQHGKVAESACCAFWALALHESHPATILGDADLIGGDTVSDQGTKTGTEQNLDDLSGGGNPDDTSGRGDNLPDPSPEK
uniref:Uncharacterized protein n=1 Tax=Sphaerodactylus townsendi TaxID=933632 RepID=A0ACB8F0Z7_9SAUR